MRFHKEIKVKLYRRNAGRLCKVWVTYAEFLVARPLLNVRQVVAYVHSLRPVAEVLPQQQVVQRTRANVVKQLKQSLALLSVFHRFLYDYWEGSKSW